MRLAFVLAAFLALWLLVRKASGQATSTGAAMPAVLPAPAPQPATSAYGIAASVDLQRAAQPDAGSAGGDALDNILQGIYQMEGGPIPGTRPYRDNNPMDVKGSPLAIGKDSGGFAIFADIGDGWQAAADWVTSHVRKHPDWTFYNLFSFALGGNPASNVNNDQGDSVRYANYVANYAGFDPGQTVSSALGVS